MNSFEDTQNSEYRAQKEIDKLDVVRRDSILAVKEEDFWFNPSVVKDISEGVQRKFYIVITICSAFIILEIIGAFISGSVAILTDAVHLISDLVGFAFSLVAISLARKKANIKFSYGFVRAEILGALFSVVIIWGMTFWITFEAIDRLVHKDYLNVEPRIMFVTSLLGLFVNLLMGFTLHGHGHDHGHGHGHSHGHSHSHGHEHGHAGCQGHSHGKKHKHGSHEHSSEEEKEEKKEKKKEREHSDDGHEHSHSDSHGKHRHHRHENGKCKHIHFKENPRNGMDSQPLLIVNTAETKSEQGFARETFGGPQEGKSSDNLGVPQLRETKDDISNGLPTKGSQPSLKNNNTGLSLDKDHLPRFSNLAEVGKNLEAGNPDNQTMSEHLLPAPEKKQRKRFKENLSVVEAEESHNVRAAWIHVIGDTVQSLGVILVAAVIWIREDWKFLDPILSLMFSIIALSFSFRVLKDIIHVMMDTTPSELDVETFEENLRGIKYVKDVHDLHVWLLAYGKPSMTCHIEVVDHPIYVLKKATLLARKQGIYHTTIQIEVENSGLEVNCSHNIHL